MLLGFQLCHCKQVAQVIEPVLLGEPGQAADGIRDEARRLVGAPIARRLAGRRSLSPR